MLGKIQAAAIFTAGFDRKSSVAIFPLIILIPKSANNYYYSAINLIKNYEKYSQKYKKLFSKNKE